MTWCGINDFCTRPYWRADRPAKPNTGTKPIAPGELFVTGSIVIEADTVLVSGAETLLLDYMHFKGWRRSVQVGITAAGDIWVEVQQGDSRSYGCLEMVTPVSGARFRLTISWDGPHRFGAMSYENPEDGSVLRTRLTSPVPIPADDLQRIVSGSFSVKTAPGISLIAVSDIVEKTGLNPSISAGSLIGTSDGPRPIERLNRGDMVLTEKNGYQPIRWIQKWDTPAVGFYSPIKLRRPYLGLSQDIFVAPHQRMIMTGTSAEYLFGRESVMVKAMHLLSYPAASLASGMRITTYYQLILDQHECIEIGGAWGASQYLGTFRYPKEFLATNPLSDLPDCAVPNHCKPVQPVLRSYETSSLLSTLSA